MNDRAVCDSTSRSGLNAPRASESPCFVVRSTRCAWPLGPGAIRLDPSLGSWSRCAIAESWKLPANRSRVGTSRCDVPARVAAGGILAPLNAAQTAQRAVPTFDAYGPKARVCQLSNDRRIGNAPESSFPGFVLK
jgi:hypothetical protein